MTLEMVRTICLCFAHVTEQILWANNLVFKVGGKMFAIARLEHHADGNAFAFKCSPEEFATLIEREGITPAPYLARAHWVSVSGFDILSGTELRKRLQDAWALVFAGLSKRAQLELTNVAVTRKPRERPKTKTAAPARMKKK